MGKTHGFLDYERTDHQTLEFKIQLGPQDKKELTMHYIQRNIRD